MYRSVFFTVAGLATSALIATTDVLAHTGHSVALGTPATHVHTHTSGSTLALLASDPLALLSLAVAGVIGASILTYKIRFKR